MGSDDKSFWFLPGNEITIILDGFVFKIISGDKLTYPLNSVFDSKFFEILSKSFSLN